MTERKIITSHRAEIPWIKSHYHFYSQLAAVLRPFTHFAICLFSAPLTSLSLAAPTRDDPCVKIAGQAIVDLAEALTCLKSFPLTFNKTLTQNVLSIVSGVFDIYTFEDFTTQMNDGHTRTSCYHPVALFAPLFCCQVGPQTVTLPAITFCPRARSYCPSG